MNDDALLDEDGLPIGPFCPQCNGELDREVVDAGNGLSVAFVCPKHGAVTIVDPFAE
jgi:hypothetical protein